MKDLPEVVYFDALAQALASVGWASRPRYESTPAQLLVYEPGVPAVGDSVSVVAGPGGVPWFRSAMGAFLAPCSDVPAAVVQIARVLTSRLAAHACQAIRRRRPGPVHRLLTALGICP